VLDLAQPVRVVERLGDAGEGHRAVGHLNQPYRRSKRLSHAQHWIILTLSARPRGRRRWRRLQPRLHRLSTDLPSKHRSRV